MQSLIDFIQAHQALLSSLAIGIIDLLITLAPKLESNGILHMVYLLLVKLATKTPPQIPPAP